MEYSQSDVGTVSKEELRTLKEKLEKLNIPAKSLNPRTYRLVLALVQEILLSRVPLPAAIDLDKNETLNKIYTVNTQLQRQHLSLSKELICRKEKLAERRARTNLDMKQDTNFKFFYDQELKLKELLQAKFRDLKRMYNDITYKLKGLNTDDLLRDKLYADFNLTNDPNHCYAKVLTFKPIPELATVEEAEERLELSEMQHALAENQRLKAEEHLLHEKLQNREQEISRLESKISMVTLSVEPLASQATISSLREQKDSLQSQLEYLLRFCKPEKKNNINTKHSHETFRNEHIKAAF